MASVSTKVDEKKGVAVVTIKGVVSGSLFHSAMRDAVGRYPGVVNFDFLFDMRGYIGGVSSIDIDECRKIAITPDDGRRCVAVVVSDDSSFEGWIECLSVMFPNRHLQHVRSMYQAMVMLRLIDR